MDIHTLIMKVWKIYFKLTLLTGKLSQCTDPMMRQELPGLYKASVIKVFALLALPQICIAIDCCGLVLLYKQKDRKERKVEMETRLWKGESFFALSFGNVLRAKVFMEGH